MVEMSELQVPALLPPPVRWWWVILDILGGVTDGERDGKIA